MWSHFKCSVVGARGDVHTAVDLPKQLGGGTLSIGVSNWRLEATTASPRLAAQPTRCFWGQLTNSHDDIPRINKKGKKKEKSDKRV